MRAKLFICLCLATPSLFLIAQRVEARSVTTELLILPLQCSLEVVDDGVQQTASYSPNECSQIVNNLDSEILPIDNSSETNEPTITPDLTVDQDSSSINSILEAIKGIISTLANLFRSNEMLGLISTLIAVIGFIAAIIYYLT